MLGMKNVSTVLKIATVMLASCRHKIESNPTDEFGYKVEEERCFPVGASIPSNSAVLECIPALEKDHVYLARL